MTNSRLAVLATLILSPCTAYGWTFKKTSGRDVDKDGGTHQDSDGFSKLVAWMRRHGGRVDDRVVVSVADDGMRGGVAVLDIEQGAELLHCPWELVIGSTSYEVQLGNDMCAVVRDLETELRLGESSLWHPYLSLDDSLINSRLPTLWEEEIVAELQGLPPGQDATRHIRWFSQHCDDGRPFDQVDEITKQALLCFLTRACEVGMLPVYDLFNHHNGLRNAKAQLAPEGVQLIATRPIPKGSQIYLSYGIKTASTMFRDYGFVESWPQTWSWRSAGTGNSHTFVRFPDQAIALYPTEELLKAIWKGGMSLIEFKDAATQHTQALTVEALHLFHTESQALLTGLATDAAEDKIILANLKDSLAQDGDGIVRLEDTISAVEYRIVFKEAVKEAMIESIRCLEKAAPPIGEEL